MFSGLTGHVTGSHGHGHLRRRSSLSSNRSSDGEREQASEEETVVDDSEKNILLSIISQLRPGADLSRITLPTFILEPGSMLERITNFMQHPENLVPLTTVEDPEERFVQVVKFYMSGWHIKPAGVKKPLNPILGEFFTCHWDLDSTHRAFYIAEQTSHHPPKSSYFYMAPQHHIRIDGTLKPQSRFLGNSAASMMESSIVQLRLLNKGPTAGTPGGGEKYILTQPNMYVRGILFGKMKYELGDHAYVKCPELDLICDIEFKVKGFFTGSYNAIGGTIKRESTDQVLYEITGSWSGEMFIKNVITGKRELLFDATHAQNKPPIVKPLEEQEERESQRLWSGVITALKQRNQQVATDEKFKIEDRQREEARMRASDGVEFRPRFFRPLDPHNGEEDGLDWILAAHVDDLATPEEQVRQILAIAPIMPGSRRSSKYDIPPHHPHHNDTHTTNNGSAKENSGPRADLDATKAASKSPPKPARTDTDLIGLDEPYPKSFDGLAPTLVPTNVGAAPAGKLGGSSGLDDMRDLSSALQKPKAESKDESIAGDDDDVFLDAED